MERMAVFLSSRSAFRCRPDGFADRQQDGLDHIGSRNCRRVSTNGVARHAATNPTTASVNGHPRS
jgi:hypothetical protein